jgi:hypothetical protein
MKIPERLEEMKPCAEARSWLEGFNGTKQEAWAACKRGDWMLWLCGKLAGPPGSEKREDLVLAACACARLSLRFVSKGEGPRIAIEVAEKWAQGRATIEEVRGAVKNAFASADAAAAAAAADAAAYAAYAAYAAADAADAADAAHAAAYAADAAAPREGMLARCADAVRKVYPRCPL